MQSKAANVQEYYDQLPEARMKPMLKLRAVLRKNLPKGFAEGMGYGMPGWDVPHTLYPPGYHCDPKAPLPFLGLASQKRHISVYHMGLYADKALLKWFTGAYSKLGIGKLDMGKCCVRVRNPVEIPFALIGELAGMMTV
jgi:hypothetical protein